MWPFRKKPAPPAAPAPTAALSVVALPVVVNPSEAQALEFAEWRIGHIARYFDQEQQEGRLVPDVKRTILETESALLQAQLSHARAKA